MGRGETQQWPKPLGVRADQPRPGRRLSPPSVGLQPGRPVLDGSAVSVGGGPQRTVEHLGSVGAHAEVGRKQSVSRRHPGAAIGHRIHQSVRPRSVRAVEPPGGQHHACCLSRRSVDGRTAPQDARGNAHPFDPGNGGVHFLFPRQVLWRNILQVVHLGEVQHRGAVVGGQNGVRTQADARPGPAAARHRRSPVRGMPALRPTHVPGAEQRRRRGDRTERGFGTSLHLRPPAVAQLREWSFPQSPFAGHVPHRPQDLRRAVRPATLRRTSGRGVRRAGEQHTGPACYRPASRPHPASPAPCPLPPCIRAIPPMPRSMPRRYGRAPTARQRAPPPRRSGPWWPSGRGRPTTVPGRAATPRVSRSGPESPGWRTTAVRGRRRRPRRPAPSRPPARRP